MRIAILDDDPSQLEFATQSLSPAGHTCHTFSEGGALIRELRRESFDLIVLDWNVTDMQGDEVLAWVRKHCNETLPVLFMTSRSRESDIVSALNAGADDYVVKPVAASRAATSSRRSGSKRPTSRRVRSIRTSHRSASSSTCVRRAGTASTRSTVTGIGSKSSKRARPEPVPRRQRPAARAPAATALVAAATHHDQRTPAFPPIVRTCSPSRFAPQLTAA